MAAGRAHLFFSLLQDRESSLWIKAMLGRVRLF